MRKSLSLNNYKFSPKGLVILSVLLLLLPVQQVTAQAIHAHDSLKTKHLWLAAQILPGSGQLYNRQYWKVPVFYAGMGSMLYLGYNANKTYQRYRSDYINLDASTTNKEFYEKRYTRMKQTRNLYYAGASAFYIASVVDALLVYNKNNHSPATATILSTILPGSGQVYNKKYWKIPIVYGGLSTFFFMVDWNNRGYVRFKRAIRQYPNDEYKGARTVAELQLIRDNYHKNRDLSFIGLAGIYVLNIIDANVDANLFDWNVDDDLTLHVEPTIINDKFTSKNNIEPAFGLTCTFNF